jgi:hypothetical protein
MDHGTSCDWARHHVHAHCAWHGPQAHAGLTQVRLGPWGRGVPLSASGRGGGQEGDVEREQHAMAVVVGI